MSIFNDGYKGKRVLVTGNTGFKGSWLSSWLVHLGADVHGFSNGIPTKPSMFEDAKIGERIDHIDGDVRDSEALRTVVDRVQPEFIFHLAAQPIVRASFINPHETFDTNAGGTLNLLEALRVVNPACIAIFITSDKCYRNVEWTWGYRENDTLGGDDPYSASKAAAEIIIHSYARSFFATPESRVRVCSVRAGNVIGGGDWAAKRIVPDAIRAWTRGEILKIRSATATRPWQHVLEPLSGYLHLGQLLREDQSLAGEAFNFGPKSSQNLTVEDLLREMSRHRLGATWLTESDQAFKEAGLLKLSCDKALHSLSWLPTLDFTETVEFLMDWYNAYESKGLESSQGMTARQIEAYELRAIERKQAWAR